MTNPVQKVGRPKIYSEEEFPYRPEVVLADDAFACIDSKEREIADLKSQIREMEDKFGLPHEDDPFATIQFVNSGTFKPRDSEDDEARKGGSIGEWMRMAFAAEATFADLKSTLKAVYEGRLTDRDRMDVVTVRLNHDTWKAIQTLWYESKRNGD